MPLHQLLAQHVQILSLCRWAVSPKHHILESDTLLFSVCHLTCQNFSKGYFCWVILPLLSSSSSSSFLCVLTSRLQPICLMLFSPFQDSSLCHPQPHWSGTIFFSPLEPAGWILAICLCVYVHVYAGPCSCSQRMGPLGGQLKQKAPFYTGKLMMWFPHSWQRVAFHLLCLMIFFHIASELGQGKRSQSVWRELASGRICSFLTPPPTVSSSLPLHTAQPPVPPGPDIDAIIKLSWKLKLTLQLCSVWAIFSVCHSSHMVELLI